ncbi:hypothetical protein EPUS_08213 [Endocarpon pusillum Z07020]|uniref:Uncharacterized protein n=1 Tax=Endocarpon pusillum (strain Z07020 / HMAS-L-300199) TaxID=1263415 RepID=U1FTS6_ENDPU|nr:uncharacterized protein EPUS_08213 [Endocarpon pusillum Z07020]ERF68147.1 hypothetical protein EPUS_08213 [Endocarpon pusillum Z07020]
MPEHLGLLLVHYLHHICSKAFSRNSKLFSCFGNANGNVSLSASFWSTIASEMSSLPKPSMTSPASEVESKTHNLSPIFQHSPVIKNLDSVGTKTIIQRRGTAMKASISRSALGKDSTSHKRVKTQASQNQDQLIVNTPQNIAVHSTPHNFEVQTFGLGRTTPAFWAKQLLSEEQQSNQDPSLFDAAQSVVCFLVYIDTKFKHIEQRTGPES